MAKDLLTDVTVRNAKSSDKDQRLNDGSGLYLLLNCFEIIAREWGSKKVETWDEKNNRSKRMLERNIFPWLGGRPISEILPKDILTSLRRVEERGTIETAHRSCLLTPGSSLWIN